MSGLGQVEDRSKVRTAEDVERKYHLGKIVENQQINDNQIVNLQTELDNFVEATASNFLEVQTELDGKVETWYYSGIPSLSNLPASDWTTNDERSKHVGDLYYNKANGYVYRFEYSNNAYMWTEIHDEKAVDALSIANNALDTADNKRRIFMTQPTPPYDNGDLWVQGSNGDIKVCQIARQEGSFVDNDWIIASKYTDNTYATAIVDELGGTTTTILSGQVVQEMANYTKFTDLATGGSTTIAGENISTGSIKSNNYEANVTGTKISLTDGTIDSKNFKLNSTGNVICNDISVNGGDIYLTGGTQSNPNFTIDDTDFYDYMIPGVLWMSDRGQTGSTFIKMSLLDEFQTPEYAEISLGKTYNTTDEKGVEIKSINTYGSIGINGGGNRQITLDGSDGKVYCVGVVQTSLESRKKNFEKLDNALDIIKNTDIYKFNLKEENDSDKKHIGFVIGDNYKYSKELTSKNNDGVDIYSFVSVCCKAIQEQQKEIEELKELLRKEK